MFEEITVKETLRGSWRATKTTTGVQKKNGHTFQANKQGKRSTKFLQRPQDSDFFQF